MSDHVLILPIGHYAATTDSPKVSIKLLDPNVLGFSPFPLTHPIQEVVSEMERFKVAMRQYCRSKGKSCVIFERNFKSQHLQLQVRKWTITVQNVPFLCG